MLKQGTITKEERENLVIPVHARDVSEITNEEIMKKTGFEVLYAETRNISNPYYEEYIQDINRGKNKEEAVKKFADDFINWRKAFSEFFFYEMFRDSKRDFDEKKKLVDFIFEKSKLKIEKNPTFYNDHFPQVFLVLQKKINSKL
jgi:hypothetical protein